MTGAGGQEDPLPTIAARASEAISEAVNRHGDLALLYSGGLESSLLLRLAKPWRDKITVYTARTGVEFPHMVAFIDRSLASWGHRIIKSDLAASFRSRGIPANVVPIEHASVFAPVFGERRQPAIVDWTTCCFENLSKRAFAAVKRDGYAAVIHGQRSGDFRASRAPLSFDGLELIAPLWDTPRSAVWQAVKNLGVALPEQYPDLPCSLDCSLCPAMLTPARRAWMAPRYPEQLKVAEALHAQVSAAVETVLRGEGTQHAFEPK